MGCCSSSDDDEHKRLINPYSNSHSNSQSASSLKSYNPASTPNPAHIRLYPDEVGGPTGEKMGGGEVREEAEETVAKPVRREGLGVVVRNPSVFSIVGHGSGFQPMEDSAPPTFSVINDTEQKLLDAIVTHAQLNIIDIGNQGKDQYQYNGLREKVNAYKKYSKQGIIGGSEYYEKNFIFSLPPWTDEEPPKEEPLTSMPEEVEGPEVFFKKHKFKIRKIHQPTMEELNLIEDYSKLVHTFRSMSVSSRGPVLVSFDL